MRIFQTIVQKVVFVALLAAGVYILAQRLGYWAEGPVLHVPESRFWAFLIALVLIAIGILALLPAKWLRKKSLSLSFADEHGDLQIQLESVQANLNKVLGKRPEVKRGSVRLVPDAQSGRVQLKVEALLIKQAGLGAKEMAERLRKFIATTASGMLGVDEVASVDLNVRGIVVDKNAVKEMVAQDTEAIAARGSSGRATVEEPEVVSEPTVSPTERDAAAMDISTPVEPAVESIVPTTEPEPVVLEDTEMPAPVAPDMELEPEPVASWEDEPVSPTPAAEEPEDLKPLPSWEDESETGPEPVEAPESVSDEAADARHDGPAGETPKEDGEARDTNLFP